MLAVKKKADILGSRLRFSRFCVVIAGAQIRYLAGADFEDLQLCSPLTYKDVYYLIWKLWCLAVQGLDAQGLGSTFKVCQVLFNNSYFTS
jgi:hypothetical protein